MFGKYRLILPKPTPNLREDTKIKETSVSIVANDSNIIKTDMEENDMIIKEEPLDHDSHNMIKSDVKEEKGDEDGTSIKIEYLNCEDKLMESSTTEYFCDKCSFKSQYKGNVKAHIRDIHENTGWRFSCNECNFGTKYKNSLKIHIRAFHQKEKAPLYSCESCSFQTLQEMHLKRHVMRIHIGMSLECKLCQKSFKKKDRLDAHYVSHHWSQSDSFKHLLTSTVHQCPKCTYQSVSTKNLRKHLHTHESGRNKFKRNSKECSQPLVDQVMEEIKEEGDVNSNGELNGDSKEDSQLLAGQLKEEIKEEDDVDGEYKPLYYELNGSCKEHSQLLADPLKEEIKEEDDLDGEYKPLYYELKGPTATTEKPFACHKCDFKSNHKRILKNHIMYIHEKAQAPQYTCNSCPYSSIRKGDLYTHMKIHTGSSLECNLCRRPFKLKHHLDTHWVSAHWDQRNSFQHLLTCKVNQCSKCSYATVNATYLKTHLLTHEEGDEKFKFKCDVCGYKSIRKSSLETHLQSHSDQSPLVCTVCYKRFSHKQHFTRHILSRHGNNEQLIKTTVTGKIYQCTKCTYKTVSSKRCNRHMKDCLD